MTRPVTARHCRVCWSVTFADPEKPSEDPKALYDLTYGLFILTSRDEKDNGCTINTCVQVGRQPTRLAISCQTENLTREIIEKTGVFNVSVLTQDVPFETIRHFGMQTGREVDKFENVSGAERSRNGLLYVTENAKAMFSCKVQEKIDLGSHMLFVGEVTESKVFGTGTPCTYAHYHKAIRPKG